jgi:hypothetical protein
MRRLCRRDVDKSRSRIDSRSARAQTIFLVASQKGCSDIVFAPTPGTQRLGLLFRLNSQTGIHIVALYPPGATKTRLWRDALISLPPQQDTWPVRSRSHQPLRRISGSSIPMTRKGYRMKLPTSKSSRHDPPRDVMTLNAPSRQSSLGAIGYSQPRLSTHLDD